MTNTIKDMLMYSSPLVLVPVDKRNLIDVDGTIHVLHSEYAATAVCEVQALRVYLRFPAAPGAYRTADAATCIACLGVVGT